MEEAVTREKYFKSGSRKRMVKGEDKKKVKRHEQVRKADTGALPRTGVSFKPLWEVTIWDKKFNLVDRHKQPKVINYPYLLAVDLFALEQEDGDVFLLSTGEQTGVDDGGTCRR